MYSTEGIILKRIDVGETDSLFTIYTKDFGKIRAFAQGIKKEGAKLKGHLEVLNLSTIHFVLGRGGERLTHASAIHYWPKVRADFDKIVVALEIASRIDEACFPGEKDEPLWSLLYGSLSALEGGRVCSSRHDFFQSFDARLLECLGQGRASP